MTFVEELKEVWIREKNYLETINPKEQKELYKEQQLRVIELERRLTDLAKAEMEIAEKEASRAIDEEIKLKQIASEEEIKLKQIASEEEIKLKQIASEEEFKRKEMKAERKNQIWRNGIEIGKVVLTVGAAVGMGLVTMVWEKTDTLTSTAGKNALKDIVKFKL